ncbi:hypothetical protein MKS85_14010 [Pseudomonas sp. JL2]|uniref:hypothetical protein n=1 Tax=Pseudomonas sp. JL2 TaxID=2919942 RepID=UPI00285FD11F|nr:hypothetical protein [Pseudomonas sp. JL2]MDR8386645.1 hypothetical protein [Pseudomonas sp. JL2]
MTQLKKKIMKNDSAVKSIQESIAKGELIVVVGTGVSISLTNNEYKQLSWTGLIESGFAFGGVREKSPRLKLSLGVTNFTRAILMMS